MTKTYQDGIREAMALLEDCKGNSTEWLIDRLGDYKYAYEQEQARMAGWNDVTKVLPRDYEQVLVTDGTEFRVLHREEGAWAFTVSPCDRSAMKFWKKLVD